MHLPKSSRDNIPSSDLSLLKRSSTWTHVPPVLLMNLSPVRAREATVLARSSFRAGRLTDTKRFTSCFNPNEDLFSSPFIPSLFGISDSLLQTNDKRK